MRASVLTMIAAVALVTAASAQTPAPKAPAPAAPAATPAKSPGEKPALPPLEPQGYTYDPDSRRDPFVSLLRRGANSQRDTVGPRAAGLAGMETSEVALKGIIASGSSYVAMVQGVDNKTYIVHVGDKLFDGTVRAIDAESMVILQQVNDPLSTQKTREVRKVLRQTEEAK
jgi:Tfp pilus assembly protein PilP